MLSVKVEDHPLERIYDVLEVILGPCSASSRTLDP